MKDTDPHRRTRSRKVGNAGLAALGAAAAIYLVTNGVESLVSGPGLGERIVADIAQGGGNAVGNITVYPGQNLRSEPVITRAPDGDISSQNVVFQVPRGELLESQIGIDYTDSVGDQWVGLPYGGGTSVVWLNETLSAPDEQDQNVYYTIGDTATVPIGVHDGRFVTKVDGSSQPVTEAVLRHQS